MQKITLGETHVGREYPCFIIAEAGVNHNGDITLAKKLIDAAASSGADAVKFQTFKADKLVTENAEKAEYQKETTGKSETQYDMIKKLELAEDDFRELKSYAEKIGIMFLSSPFDFDSVNLLEKLDVPAFKVGSGEITNHPLLKHIARKKKPIILSTGMSYLNEVADAVNAIQEEGNDDIILLHAVSNYPARIEDSNLRSMETMRKTFNLPVGYSDHTPGIIVPITAAALGAVVIEKHFTLNKNMKGPDHRASLEPEELKEMVESIRLVEKALGNGEKRPVESEMEMRDRIRRSVVAYRNIEKEGIIRAGDLDYMRPGTGISPANSRKIIGKKAKHLIKKGEIISWEDLE